MRGTETPECLDVLAHAGHPDTHAGPEGVPPPLRIGPRRGPGAPSAGRRDRRPRSSAGQDDEVKVQQAVG